MAEDIFGRFYAGVNKEWPQYGMSETDATDQERRWRSVLGRFSTEALSAAMKHALSTAKKRPTAADFVQWATEHTPKMDPVSRRPDVPVTHCDCGCGGKRWYLLLRDRAGQLRQHAPTVEAMTAKLPHELESHPEARAQLERLAGQPMLRLKSECRKAGGSPMPPLAQYVGVEDGIPVYDVRPG